VGLGILIASGTLADFAGWVERSETHQCRRVWRWVSLRSTHPARIRLRVLATRFARQVKWPYDLQVGQSDSVPTIKSMIDDRWRARR
jgi:hypothetical protein